MAYNGAVHTRRWAQFFADRGHEVHVVTCGSAGASGGYRVHDLGRTRGGKVGYLAKLRRARRIVRGLEPDLVHAHYATSYGLLGSVAGVHPFVVTAHGDDLLISPRNPVMRRLVRHVLRRADLATVPSEPMRRAAIDVAGASAPPIVVFQYGVESDRLDRLARDVRAGRPDAAVRPLSIVSARPLLRLYRLDVLLQALAAVKREDVDFLCTIAGDGPERTSLETLAIDLGLAERVTFVGQVPPTEVEELLAAGDIAISIAESDGASLALLEALALGCVPVVSDIPANRPWVTDGVNGVVVPIEPGAVAAGIMRARALDAATVAEANRVIVRDRADRARNLGGLERRLEQLLASGRAPAVAV